MSKQTFEVKCNLLGKSTAWCPGIILPVDMKEDRRPSFRRQIKRATFDVTLYLKLRRF
jgi:hypothetical protein